MFLQDKIQHDQLNEYTALIKVLFDLVVQERTLEGLRRKDRDRRALSSMNYDLLYEVIVFSLIFFIKDDQLHQLLYKMHSLGLPDYDDYRYILVLRDKIATHQDYQDYRKTLKKVFGEDNKSLLFQYADQMDNYRYIHFTPMSPTDREFFSLLAEQMGKYEKSQIDILQFYHTVF